MSHKSAKDDEPKNQAQNQSRAAGRELYPALACWDDGFRPFGAGFLQARSRPITRNQLYTNNKKCGKEMLVSFPRISRKAAA